jgi:hypothetical protein
LSLRRNPVEGGRAHPYIGAIDNGGAVQVRRRKMKSYSSGSSENVLFAALIAVAVGWAAVSAASAASLTSEQLAQKQAASCAVAQAAPAASAGLAAIPAAHSRCSA